MIWFLGLYIICCVFMGALLLHIEEETKREFESGACAAICIMWPLAVLGYLFYNLIKLTHNYFKKEI